METIYVTSPSKSIRMDQEEDRKIAAVGDRGLIADTENDSKATNRPAPMDPSLFIEKPEPMDVICGRGKSGPHPGNQRFRRIIMDNKVTYQQSKRREEKSRITQTIVEELTTGPTASRFLLKDPKTQLWYDAGLEYAREKVSHALRSRPFDITRKKSRPKKKGMRKSFHTPEIEEAARKLIQEQQQLLKSMIDKKVFPVWMQDVKESLNTGS